MKRREFIRNLGLTLAAGWTARRILWPLPAEASSPEVRLALLADAHLRDGNDKRPEARLLVRAVAEIRAFKPAPDLVLFAGDLAHDGDPRALALGREILADLPAPVLAVRGEGDGSPKKGEVGWELFSKRRFCGDFEGVNLLGLDTVWQDIQYGPGFALGEEQRRWLASKITRIEPTKPLVVLSHAPLEPVFRPWGQWTVDSEQLLHQLTRFPHVLCLNGHVHQAGVSNCITGFSYSSPLTENLKPKTTNLSIPSTAWPLPLAQEGTPRKLRPGLGPRGCGWLLVSWQRNGWEVESRSWPA